MNIQNDRITAPEDVLLTPEMAYADEPPEQPGTSSLVWEYHNQGTINGVGVAKDDIGLPVDSDDLLASAFLLDRRPRFDIFVLSPDEGAERYSALLDRMHRNEIVILEETKQYEPSAKGFVVLVRYDELEYRLNPRYKYLREDIR